MATRKNYTVVRFFSYEDKVFAISKEYVRGRLDDVTGYDTSVLSSEELQELAQCGGVWSDNADANINRSKVKEVEDNAKEVALCIITDEGMELSSCDPAYPDLKKAIEGG